MQQAEVTWHAGKQQIDSMSAAVAVGSRPAGRLVRVRNSQLIGLILIGSNSAAGGIPYVRKVSRKELALCGVTRGWRPIAGSGVALDVAGWLVRLGGAMA